MPELPEVETVAKALHRTVSGRRILSSQLIRQRLAPHTPASEFAAQIRECQINFVHRRGKNILFDLDNGKTLLAHLRMSGRFMNLPPHEEDPKFTHAVFHLDSGRRLVFQDQRHFGLMKVLPTDRLHEDEAIAKLAPEPFSDEFSEEYLLRMLRASGRSLKEFLLDQTRVCGLGNIYASEAMFHAGVSPRRLAKNVQKSRVGPLHASILAVLRQAIAAAETLAPDPVVIGEGVYGTGTRAEWHVYDREAEECSICGTAVRRIRQGTRSTYYCPKCQR